MLKTHVVASGSKPYEGAHLQAPYFLTVAGLSYESLGTLLQGIREFGPGCYKCLNGKNQLFLIHLFDDGNWDFQSPQLDLFKNGSTPDTYKENRYGIIQPATKSPHTLT